MYAVVITGGKQYKVAQGDRLRVERIKAAIGETVELGQVCLLAQESGVVTDAATLASAKVMAEIVGEGRRKKIKVYKKKRRKNYARTYGHRQGYTEIQINAIVA